MSHRPPTQDLPDPSITLTEGWHCTHIYYSFDRAGLAAMESGRRAEGCEQLQQLLESGGDNPPQRLQTSIVSGHKADFGLMVMDPDPLVIDRIHQQLAAGPLGPVLKTGYSFVSVTEISEYVPSLEQYGERLVAEGEDAASESYQAKMSAYERRAPVMKKQRLTPEFPDWPVTCFYPMNKKRKVGENWFSLPFTERNALMAEHAQTGMTFAGKASQLITVGVGLEDWEWGVTLWARNPMYLKDIVYRMRFDEASARYAEFGPFFTSYICSAAEMLRHCGISS
jgi:chlorite dismutase